MSTYKVWSGNNIRLHYHAELTPTLFIHKPHCYYGSFMPARPSFAINEVALSHFKLPIKIWLLKLLLVFIQLLLQYTLHSVLNPQLALRLD